MATIVRSKRNRKKYILLGAGFGAYESKKGNWLLGDLSADTNKGTIELLCVSDSKGNINWIYSSDLIVVSINGVKPEDIL